MSTRRTIGLLVLAIVAGALLGSLTSGQAPGTLTLLSLTALAVLASALIPARRRADPPEVAAPPREPSPARQRPIAPPPTRGRWDEAPRV